MSVLENFNPKKKDSDNKKAKKRVIVKDYSDEYCDELLSYAESGKSIHTFIAEGNFHQATVAKWIKQRKEFGEALELAQSKQIAFLENKVINAVSSNEMSVALLQLKEITKGVNDLFKPQIEEEMDLNINFDFVAESERKILTNVEQMQQTVKETLDKFDNLINSYNTIEQGIKSIFNTLKPKITSKEVEEIKSTIIQIATELNINLEVKNG